MCLAAMKQAEAALAAEMRALGTRRLSKPMEQQGPLFCAPHTSCNNGLLADPGYREDQHVRGSRNLMQEVGLRHAIEQQLRILNRYFALALRRPAQAVLPGNRTSRTWPREIPAVGGIAGGPPCAR